MVDLLTESRICYAPMTADRIRFDIDNFDGSFTKCLP
jgi:hypothetical protein